MATLNVGANSTYKTIAAAVGATQDGDTVLVQAGTYTNDFFTISHKITLQSVGGMAYDIATVAPPNGKAIATVDTDATIDGFGFSGAADRDNNGAGIRYEAGKLVVNHSVFWGNQDGLLGNADANGSILVENSEFSANGAGDGFSHNLYIGAVASFTLLNSYVHDAVVGHEVKSRALSNTIQGNRIFDNSSNPSYSIDLPDGGADTISNNVIEKGASSQNYTTVHFGGEGTPYANSSLSVTGNTFVSDNPNAILVNNATPYAASLSNNALWGYTKANTGAVSESQDAKLSARPTLDLSTVAPAVTSGTPGPGPSPTTAVPAGAHLVDPGPGGAVAASGRVLVVGAGKPFTTLASALAASKDGDTIDVMAGTYVNDFGNVTHKVIIQGVGGIAHFTETPGLLDAPDLLDINADATLSNLEFSGARSYNGHAGGIGIHAGTVTVNNSLFDGNDQSIYTDDSASISLAIYGSEISGNGNDAKGTHNLRAGVINSLVIRNSAVHGGFSGHEISTSSYYTDIENSRIWDGAGVGASFAIDLSDAGNAVIRNNVIEKGPASANGVVILDGGEGPTYDNSNVVITGNTLISDFQDIYRPWTYFIAGASSPYAAPPTTVTGNTFAGAAPGSQQTVNIANVGSNTTAASGTIDMTTPGYSAALAPPAFAQGAPDQYDTLSVSLTDTATLVGAQFLVSVDGVVAGGGVVTANDGTQAPQVFTYTGSWGSGSHAVSVTGLNLGGAGNLTATNLYVDKVVLNTATSNARLALDGYTTTGAVSLTANLPDFDDAFYLAHNPDVAKAGVDPLQHFLQYGWKEGRNPNAFFNVQYYLNQNPDVAASGVNPLLQFEQTGWQQGRDPSALFSVSKYIAANSDAARAGIDPLQHFLQTGAAQGRAIYAATPHNTVTTDPLVDAAYYYAQNPAIAATGQDAGVAYHANVWTSTANPDAYFDTRFYLASNPDVAAAHVDPLQHFEQYGWKEGRDPSASFSIKAYEAANPSAATSGVDPLVTFLQSGTAPADVTKSPYAVGEAKYFDAAYYLAHNPAVAASHADPLTQYHTTGWKLGSNPSAAFDSKQYLAHNRDVARSGMDPLLHYATFGVYEGRAIYAVTGS